MPRIVQASGAYASVAEQPTPRLVVSAGVDRATTLLREDEIVLVAPVRPCAQSFLQLGGSLGFECLQDRRGQFKDAVPGSGTSAL